MQAAVDCNGSNNKNVISTIATTTTNTTTTTTNNISTTIAVSDDFNSSNNNAQVALSPFTAENTVTRTATPTSVTLAEKTTTTTTPIAISPLLAEHQQPTTTQNVLRNRLQLGKSTNSHNFNASTATRYENGQAQLRFDAAEYLGSNVEQMSVTPSPSPNVSPSKKVNVSNKDDAAAAAVTVAAAAVTVAAATKSHADIVISPNNVVAQSTTASASLSPLSSLISSSASSSTSSSSSSSSSASATNSNSNSTTSSVIATPILVRNGNAKMQAGCGAAGDAAADDEELLPFKKISLPIKSASFSTFDDEHLKKSSITNNSTSASSSANSSVTPITLTPTSISAKINTKSTKMGKGGKSKAAATEAEEDEEELLHWKDMPQYLQFNPYVLKGYRPLQTFKGCLFSLFYWHNETINILTHALPIVYILAIVPGLMPWEREYRFLSFCHVFGSVAPWCGSFIYHLFMNIEKGETCYYRLLKLDMVGIWVSQSFGALPLVTATTFCFTHKWKWLFIITYCLMSLWGLYKALTASSPWQRRLCFALPFTMRSVLTFLRTLGVVGGNAVALPHVYLQDVVSILGGAIGAMRIPEKWFPGLVDFYLNSHNIMHVLVVVAVYSMHKATIKDFEWMSTTTCNGLTNATNETLETTFNANIEL